MLIEDEEIKAVAAMFASSGNEKFTEAVVSAYSKLCGLGKKFSKQANRLTKVDIDVAT